MSASNAPRTRRAAVAGQFYPANPVELRRLVEALLQSASPPVMTPKAIIAPHAGFLYSGPVAASAYACLAPERKKINRIVLLGPAHFVAVRGLAASSAEAFVTPLGAVPVDLKAVRQLFGFPAVCVSDEAHFREHSLEVQLPFLQVLLEDFLLIPLAVGEATAAEVARVLDSLWGGPETRIVISSDLSHYLDSDSARRLDRATADAIEGLKPEKLGENQACGRVPICGLLHAASAHRLRAHTVDLRNSGDTAGPRDHVVGYGAFAFRAVA